MRLSVCVCVCVCVSARARPVCVCLTSELNPQLPLFDVLGLELFVYLSILFAEVGKLLYQNVVLLEARRPFTPEDAINSIYIVQRTLGALHADAEGLIVALIETLLQVLHLL